MRALVVDDEILSARLVSELLIKAGYTVDMVAEGSVAVARLSQEAYDLLVCDWLLPDLDGPDVAKAIRARGNHSLPIILVSAVVASKETRAHVTRAGADALIRKPLNRGALLEAVAAAREQRRTLTGLAVATSPSQSRAWADIVENSRLMLSSCIRAPLALQYGGAVVPQSVISGHLQMASPAHVLALDVGLYATPESCTRISKLMIDEAWPDEQMMADVLAELSNNVLGAAKTSLRQEGFEFTLGVPASSARPSHASLLASLSPVMSVCFVGEGVSIHTVLGIRPISRTEVPASSLDETMILAEPLYTPGGVLIVPAGTRVTEAVAAKVAQQLAAPLPTTLVSVCKLAA